MVVSVVSTGSPRGDGDDAGVMVMMVVMVVVLVMMVVVLVMLVVMLTIMTTELRAQLCSRFPSAGFCALARTRSLGISNKST